MEDRKKKHKILFSCFLLHFVKYIELFRKNQEEGPMTKTYKGGVASWNFIMIDTS